MRDVNGVIRSYCRPIATKSRKYSAEDKNFIDHEIDKLLKEDIIEASTSPWRAQVVVAKPENHKKRLVIDYSQTINLFTLLDAYPLPRIDDLVHAVSKYRVFSTLDLRNAYHQIPLLDLSFLGSTSYVTYNYFNRML